FFVICVFLYWIFIFKDNQTRQIQDAVSNVEKHFGELCQIFAGYVRKTARLRDKADLLVNEIYAYAATETPNLKVGLKNFADEFSRLQDYRQAEVDRLEAKVVEPLKSYGTIVKLKRDDLKATLTAKNREAKQLTQLEKTRQRNPSDRHIISQVSVSEEKIPNCYCSNYAGSVNLDISLYNKQNSFSRASVCKIWPVYLKWIKRIWLLIIEILYLYV
uniref:Family with sequence similarity 92 member A n=1 Tax=Athene cunicularia TaxID=194338 RepID=A0A663MYD5_ATHCN